MEFLNHLWQSATVLSMFYLVYVLFLRKDTLFTAKRHYFLSGILVALLFPFIQITQTVYKEAPIMERAVFSDEIIPIAQTAVSNEVVENNIDWAMIFLGIYAIVVFVLFVRLTIQCLSLVKLIKSHTIKKSGKYRFVQVPDKLAPFSFFRYIVYNPTMHSQEELEMILQHEKVHVSQWHSIDILFGNLIQIIQWVNPLSWLYKRSMEENLEFIADGKTVNRVASKKQYQLTMVKASSTWTAPSLTIQFYQSFIKKRIVMLNKQHSKKRNALKAIIVLPLLALFLWGFNVKQVVQYEEPEVPLTIETDTTESTTPILLEETEEEPILAEATASEPNEATPVNYSSEEEQEKRNKLYIINGKEIRESELPEDQKMNIQGKISVYKPEEAIAIYGDKGSEGVVTIDGNVKPQIANASEMQTRKELVAQFRYRIHKNSSDSELKQMKDELKKEHGIDLSYTVVRNEGGEITTISMSYSGNRRNGSYSISEDDNEPIDEFEFYMLDDGETGFYSEAQRLRRQERMKGRLAEMEVRQKERIAEHEERMKERIAVQERRMERRSEEMKERRAVRSEEMEERREEMREHRSKMRDRLKEHEIEIREHEDEMDDHEIEVVRIKERMDREGRGRNTFVYSDSNHSEHAIITKNTTDAELKQMKKDLSAKGITINYKRVKRNSRGEITSIKLDVKDGKGRSQTSIRSDTDKAIDDIIIEI